jgi:hypothetical protein
VVYRVSHSFRTEPPQWTELPYPHELRSGPVEDRTRHQIALRLLPFLFIVYIINFLDRTNVAYAAIGMAREILASMTAFLAWAPASFSSAI